MEKNIKMIVATHKKYEMPKDLMYVPLQVGADGKERELHIDKAKAVTKCTPPKRDYDFDSHKELVPMQPGDVETTYADTKALEKDFGYKPSTDLRQGLKEFAKWYKEYYKI